MTTIAGSGAQRWMNVLDLGLLDLALDSGRESEFNDLTRRFNLDIVVVSKGIYEEMGSRGVVETGALNATLQPGRTARGDTRIEQTSRRRCNTLVWAMELLRWKTPTISAR